MAPFQSTPPRGGRPGCLCRDRHGCLGFNPRPRAGGDPRADRLRVRPAPVSIHAPARGATGSTRSTPRETHGFNPRPRAGGDRSSWRWSDNGHARFNPRPRAGGDPTDRRAPRPHGAFQSTPPRGGRPMKLCHVLNTLLFQSTPPRGGRPTNSARNAASATVSIHAPARGATFAVPRSPSRFERFQSTPPRGGRPLIVRYSPTEDRVSIHAPARGATQRLCDKAVERFKFQSTPPRGGRPVAILNSVQRTENQGSGANLSANRVENLLRLRRRCCKRLLRPDKLSSANLPGVARPLPVRTSPQTTSGPSRSRLGLAPTCSTRRRQLAPR